MSIYEPLKAYLRLQTAKSIKSVMFTFGEIEAIIGRELPRAAYETDVWWMTQTAWQEVGWKMITLDKENEIVRFSHK